MSRVLNITFSILALFSVLFLAFISVTSLYAGESGEIPGLLYIIKNHEKGILEEYNTYFNTAVIIPVHADVNVFLSGVFLAVFTFVFKLLMFFSVAGAPLMLLLSAALLIKNAVKKIQDDKYDNETLSLAVLSALISQLYHVIYTILGLKHVNSSFAHLAALSALILLFLIISECNCGSLGEHLISFLSKFLRILLGVFIIYSMFCIRPFVPQTKIMQIFYAFSCLEILSILFGSFVFASERRGLTYIVFNNIIAQAFFISAHFLQNGFDVDILIRFVIINLVILTISEIFIHIFAVLTVKYSYDTMRQILTGCCDGSSLLSNDQYNKGIHPRAIGDLFKILLMILILIAALLFINFGTLFIFEEVFAFEPIDLAHLIRCILTIGFSVFYIWYLEDNVICFNDRLGKNWNCRSSSVCIFVYVIYSAIILTGLISPIILFDLSFDYSEKTSLITYSIIPACGFVITNIVFVFYELSYLRCYGCGYINTEKFIRSSSSSSIKHHFKKTEGHYTYDETSATTTSKTRGNSDYEHHYKGSLVGKSYGSVNSETTSTTNYKTKRWVEGTTKYEGKYRHTRKLSKYSCCCCDCSCYSSEETSKFIGY